MSLSRSLALIAFTLSSAAAAAADRAPPSEDAPAAPPPLWFTFVWVDHGASLEDASPETPGARPGKSERTTRTVYTVYGKQLTRTLHIDDMKAAYNDVTTKGALEDPRAIVELVPAYKKTEKHLLPDVPDHKGARIDVTITFGGDTKSFTVAGETPREPTKELAELAALRDALDAALDD